MRRERGSEKKKEKKRNQLVLLPPRVLGVPVVRGRRVLNVDAVLHHDAPRPPGDTILADNLLLALGPDAERRHGVRVARLAPADVHPARAGPELVALAHGAVVRVAPAPAHGRAARLARRVAGVDPELAPEHRRHQRRLADEDADAVLAQGPQRRYTLLLQL